MNAAIGATLIGVTVLGAWMLRQAYPYTRATRLLNALLADKGGEIGFDWNPEFAPATFRKETRPASPEFADAVAHLDVRSCPTDWNCALRLAEHLASRARDFGPIQSDLGTMYAQIQEGYGYCADFVKVFLGLAHAAGLSSRQWDFSQNGFGGRGHAIVEVFDRDRGKWLFLDVYNNFHVRDARSMEPWGALEFRNALLHGEPAFVLAPNGAGRAGYPVEEKLLAYYRSGLQEWYMVCGNAVFSYDAHLLVHWASRYSGGFGKIVATIVGVHPSIEILRTHENEERVRRLTALAERFRLVLAIFGMLVLLLVVQLGMSGLG